jgi:dTDP-4-amino-4,6-dideoxygalactose transaminase
MLTFKIPFSGRGHDYTEEEISAVADAMRKADPLTQGIYQEEFQKKFSVYNENTNCFALSSCTAALEMAALLCRLKPGDEVIIPAHTFCATAISFARTGANIVWADIDPDTREISVDSIKKLITKRTKVVVPVHLYGLMAPMPEIMELAHQYDLLVVEDCAQALGASLNGIKTGNFGDFACFSFHTHKNINTLGEGGMFAVKNDADAKLVRGLRHNGLRGYGENRARYWVPAMSNVDFDIAGVWPYNYCIGEIQCAVGTKLLSRLDKMIADRNRKAKKVKEALADYPELSFQKIPDRYHHSYHLLSARYDAPLKNKNRDDFIERMSIEHGIQLVVQYYPLYRYPLFAKAGFGKADCPNTDRFFDNMVSFPFHHWLSENDLDYMIECTIETSEFFRKG